VGMSPRLEPGGCFEYVSGVSLATPHGKIRGCFHFLASDRVNFDVEVATTEFRCHKLK